MSETPIDRVPADDISPEWPDGETGLEPWPAPRGPHLPGVLRVLPTLAWLFVVLAVVRLGWGLREAGFSSTIDPWHVGQVVLFEMPSVVSILLAAALLARHRDAPARLRTLFLGMVLLAVVEGLRVLGAPLEPVFEQLTPADPSVTFLVPSAIVYQVAINLLNALAVAVLAQGLLRARRYEDQAGSWPISAILAGLVVVVAVTGVVSVSRLPAEQLPLTVSVVTYIVSTVVLNVVSAGAFAYLAATATAGARVPEDPGRGWRAGALGGWLVIGSLAALGIAGLVEATPDTGDLMNDVVLGIEAVFSLGFLALLAAFVLGVPALEPLGDEDGADDPGAEHDLARDDAEALDA